MRIEAYAKVNLTLEVFGTRPDGYHALRSVVMPISLADTLEVEATADGSVSSDTGYGDDLCVKAARVLRARQPEPGRLGAAIRVTKRIPAGGGLGGGSADAAATLIALNDIWGTGLARGELAEVGAEVGSDVPSLVLGHDGGPVLMEGRGERAAPLGATGGRALDIVLVNPGVFSSTGEVYSKCGERLPSDGKIVYNMRRALEAGDIGGVAAALMNDLLVPAVALHPEIGVAMERMKAAGAEGVMMSGSGSTVFGLVPSEARGREIAALMEAEGFWARCVRTIVR